MSPVAGTAVAILLSLVSAAGYALAAVAQSRLASASAGGPGALRRLLARPQWWWAVGLNAAGALAHVAALHYGPLTLVQPLGALTLVAALPIGAYGAHRRVTRAEWRGALWTLVGLVGLVAVTGPAAPGEALNLREALIVTAATLLLIGLLASRSRAHAGTASRGRGLGHATASGMASGVGSALTQTLTAALARDLPGGPTGWWQTALLAVLIATFAVGGLLLSQAAYRGGLAAPLAVVNLSNPAAAAVIGVALLGETFRAGAWGWVVAATASLVAARGVVLLTTGLGTETGQGGEGQGQGRGQGQGQGATVPDAAGLDAVDLDAVDLDAASADAARPNAIGLAAVGLDAISPGAVGPNAIGPNANGPATVGGRAERVGYAAGEPGPVSPAPTPAPAAAVPPARGGTAPRDVVPPAGPPADPLPVAVGAPVPEPAR